MSAEEQQQLFEEGEVKVIDDENYIIADTLFEFKYHETSSINWRNISTLQFDNTTGLPYNLSDPTRELLLNI